MSASTLRDRRDLRVAHLGALRVLRVAVRAALVQVQQEPHGDHLEGGAVCTGVATMD